MKRSILFVLFGITLIFEVTTIHAATPIHLWSQSFGSTGSDHGEGVAIDASGNVLVTGSFTGTVDFGGGGLVGAGGTDIFLARYSATGVYQWSWRFGGTGSDAGTSVAVDASGNVFVTGSFTGTVDFGGGGLVSAGGTDIFLAKYDADGTYQWSQRFGGTSTDVGYSVAADGAGNVFLTGFFNGTVDFGGGGLVSAGGNDIFLAKYDSNGVHQWSQRFGGAGGDFSTSIAVDGSGDVFMTGYFPGTVDFGGGGLVSAGGVDVFLAKYDASGVHQWSQRFGGVNNDPGYAVAVDDAGNVMVTGYFGGSVDFGGGNLVSAGSGDVFVAKYDGSGTHQWSKRLGGTGSDTAYAIASDAAGNVFVTGSFSGTADFGGTPLVSAGGIDVFVAMYDANGVHRWSRGMGGIDVDYGRAIAATASGHAMVTGYFIGTVNFGGADLASAGMDDIFVADYATNLPEPAITSIADIGNDQGRLVKIRFERSGYDDASSGIPVTSYEAYRRDNAPPASSMVSEGSDSPSRRTLFDDGWTQVGTVAAHGKTSYGIDVPTIGDSTIASGQYYSTFFIRAATGTPTTYFDSSADSGYSVDNLAPGIPSNLVYNSGVLAWNQSTAEDFDYFTVYGAATNDFGSATVVDYSVSPSMDVTSAGYVYYFVTATDFSGNEGKPAKINTLSGVGGTPASYVLSVSNFPNPFNPSTTVSYTVPSRGNVTVAIYDARGARVATLVNNETRDAGAYRMEWNGRTDGGTAVSSGIYFARIEHNGAARTKKMVLLK